VTFYTYTLQLKSNEKAREPPSGAIKDISYVIRQAWNYILHDICLVRRALFAC